MSGADPRDRLRRRLVELGEHVRARVLASRQAAAPGELAAVVGSTRADVIYAVDRVSEAAITEWFRARWPAEEPVQLVMEGIEDHERVTFPAETPAGRLRWTCLLDPVDGTRNLMYDKRSAWVLAGLAPYGQGSATLAEIEVAAMVELPPAKQGQADSLSVVRGAGPDGLVAERVGLDSGRRARWRPRPSPAVDFNHGFASIARFLPEGKEALAGLEEELWRRLGPAATVVFEDQYISTGGQFFQLLAGHDRFLADLRPEVLALQGQLGTALVCHPYDVAAALVAQEAGVVLERPDGSPLDAPLDTTSPVSWVGYANPRLAELVRPVLTSLLQQLRVK
ncbi:MAG: inositol monophosphatase [Verrucomicrobiota bacterium]